LLKSSGSSAVIFQPLRVKTEQFLCEQIQGCNSAAVLQVMMGIIRDYSALSLGISAERLTQLVSVSSHFTFNLLTAITYTYQLPGMIDQY